MTVNKIEIQDTQGNVLYPHTSGDLIQYNDDMSVVQKIDEAMASLANLKAGLATAVNNKAGSSLNSDSTLADITSKINEIVTLSSGTADATVTAENILSGKTAYTKGNKITGTMVNKSNTTTQWCGYETCICQPNSVDPSQGMITFPNYGAEGYYDLKSFVIGNLGNLNAGNIKAGVKIGRSSNHGADSTNTITGTFTSDATANASQILSGQTAYVNGAKITGVASIDTLGGVNFKSGSFTITKESGNITIACECGFSAKFIAIYYDKYLYIYDSYLTGVNKIWRRSGGTSELDSGITLTPTGFTFLNPYPNSLANYTGTWFAIS